MSFALKIAKRPQAAYSGVIRPVIPITSGHPFRFDPAGESGHPKFTRAEIDAAVSNAAQILQLDDYLDRLPKALSAGDVQGSYPQPDWALVHRGRKGVTLALLWEGIGPSTPTATATVGFVNFTPVGRAVCRRSCASATLPGSGYSWIMPDRCRLPRDRRGQVQGLSLVTSPFRNLARGAPRRHPNRDAGAA